MTMDAVTKHGVDAATMATSVQEVPGKRQLLSTDWRHASGSIDDRKQLDAVALHNSTSSPLLRLPAELRAQIYDYILSKKTIHVGIRRRQLAEPGGYPREDGKPIKLLHTVCSCNRAWDEAYSMSQSPEPDVEENYDQRGLLNPVKANESSILRSYYADHRICNSVLHDFQWRDFMSTPAKECCCPFPCIHYFEYRAAMIEQHGKAPDGLYRKHASTKYELALLRTCRLINKEATMLPYNSNTFAFQNRMDMNFFLDKVLTTTQRNAVHRINVCMRSLANPTLPETIPEGLKILECFVVNDNGEYWQDLEPWKHRFDHVQVLSGWDGKSSILQEPRSRRRERAVKLEKFFAKLK